ncbi:MAG TPA: formate--tetrahydrofolate ligase [Coriobacteriia bacterium]
MLSDVEIAQRAPILPITEIAERAGIEARFVEPYGVYKAKVRLSISESLAERPSGKYVVVTAITPTPLGEGKTLTTVGLGQALARTGRSAFTCIRQPSLGPVFGIKGGAAGGGNSQVLPMTDFNLHLTGDAHAVTTAHDLCSAFIDNSLHHRSEIDLDPYAVTWRRVLDISDRALRNVVVGLGGRFGGVPRETGFDITSASELMAVLALSDDLHDLRARIGRIVIGSNRAGKPVTTEDLKVAGAMTVLMRDAVMPNLLQNMEGGPVFVHAGPFGNIAHGNSSIIADRIALKLADYTVTEAGFGADLGFEKFCNIKCRTSGLAPDCAVLVCTVRALKAHSGHYEVRPGRPLDPRLQNEDLAAVTAGLPNLIKQIENVAGFGVPVVVAVNRFPADTDAEHALIREAAMAAGADAAVSHTLHADGGEGGMELADAVAHACASSSALTFSYAEEDPPEAKIESLARGVYGADGVDFSKEALRSIARFTEMGFGGLPVCVAKSSLSLSHDPELKGRPTGWTLPVRDVRLSAGAGFLYVLCGDIMTMPGLPSHPAGENVDIDADGNIVGLF